MHWVDRVVYVRGLLIALHSIRNYDFQRRKKKKQQPYVRKVDTDGRYDTFRHKLRIKNFNFMLRIIEKFITKFSHLNEA